MAFGLPNSNWVPGITPQEVHVPVGQYQWPFQCQLPPLLPPSWRYRPYSNFANEGRETTALLVPQPHMRGCEYGEVYYEVAAHCAVRGMLTWDLRHSVPLLILQSPASLPPATPSFNRHTSPVTLCCCIGRGALTASAHLNKNLLLPGEVAGLVVEADNSSKEDISAVEVHLRCDVVLRANGYEERQRKSWQLGAGRGLLRGRQAEGSGALHFQLQLPQGLPASLSTRLISCTYTLQVVFVASSLVANVRLDLPVMVSRVQPAMAVGYPVAPEFWKPMIMPTLSLGGSGISPGPAVNPGPYTSSQYPSIGPIGQGAQTSAPFAPPPAAAGTSYAAAQGVPAAGIPAGPPMPSAPPQAAKLDNSTGMGTGTGGMGMSSGTEGTGSSGGVGGAGSSGGQGHRPPTAWSMPVDPVKPWGPPK
eukprot:CAMPEP_0202921136 /NCGR_PEP_ID=MMETSP1392-20130828/77224_1 /ASSEMBLY_ACC=CAM_ASM_000868 /TAXON_ID=225041 /ORGANISM="Chlamydomonas chlamydogama, Strain SAG 11-48b" /LENGTH=418 /DNA_ID=CAMNT_0049614683 /DNA_START=242 /DNA_END=1498 /DNA_ORIENTATION=+